MRTRIRIGVSALILVLVTLTAAFASDGYWCVKFIADNGAGRDAATPLRVGITPDATDGVDFYKDLTAQYRFDYCKTLAHVVAVIPDDSGNTYRSDFRAGDLAVPKVWQLRVDAGTMSDAAQIRLRIVATGLDYLPPSGIDGYSIRYVLKMLDNRGVPGAPANGTEWVLPAVPSSEDATWFTLPMLLPARHLAGDHQSMLDNGYVLEFRQELVGGGSYAPQRPMQPQLRVPAAEITTPTEGTIAWAKTLDDTESVSLADKVVTVGPGLFNGFTYVEEQDRSSGIRVACPSGCPDLWQIVSVSGDMATASTGERYITNATITASEDSLEMKPVSMGNRELGGEALGNQNGITGGLGLNNIGLLVRAWGRITHNGTTFMYLDDGHTLNDGSGYPGVRVETDQLASGNTITFPTSIGESVFVTGISSCDMSGANLIRVLRPRSQSDILETGRPTITSSVPSVLRTRRGPITYTLTFVGATSVVSAESFASYVSLVTEGTASGSVKVSGTGNTTRTVTISNIRGNGKIGIAVAAGTATDSMGVSAAALGGCQKFQVDDQGPTVAISAPSVSSTDTGPITYTITYSDAETVTLADADVELNSTGTACGRVSVCGEGKTSRTVTISDITGDGTLGISIASDTARDDVGNPSPVAGPSGTCVVDTAPLVYLSEPSVLTASWGPVSYAVTYQGADAVTLSSADVSLVGVPCGTVSVSGTGNVTRTVTIANITGAGTLGIAIAAGTATDTANHAAPAAGPSATFTVVSAVHVKPGGDDGNDGSTWALAKASIQSAVDVATTPGTEIWVAEGTYGAVSLTHDVGLYGGFAGSETGREQRDPSVHISRLDGLSWGAPVLCMDGLTNATTVDGFTVTRGSSGIVCRNSTAVISGNTVTGNSNGNYGGGIYCYGGSAVISGNTITSNHASYGGGICCDSGVPMITGNSISGNSSSFGGGIACLSCSGALVTDNTITGNHSWHGGGVYGQYSVGSVTCNAITDNQVDNGRGGALYSEYGAWEFADNVVTGNHASEAGAVCCYRDNAGTRIHNNLFRANSAFYFPGAIGLFDIEGEVPITNNLFIANSGVANMQVTCYGGAIEIDESSSLIAGNTFAGNRIQNGLGTAIGVGSRQYNRLTRIVNNIFYDSGPAPLAASVYADPYTSATIRHCDAFNPGAINTESLHYQGYDPVNHLGHIPIQNTNCSYVDPLFEDVANGDYHLKAGSLCIDAGDDSIVQSDWQDIDHENRVFSDHVDIGADESQNPGEPQQPISGYVCAVATGKTQDDKLKITLYWSSVPAATGYNICRGTDPGGEDNDTPVNGGTPVTTPCYAGSSGYTYTDDNDLVEGITYYYIVKALGAWGEGDASEEASCEPNPAGIPWDTGDATAILAASRAAFPDEPIPTGSLTVGGPDGRVYKDGSSTWSLEEGYVDGETNTVVLDGGQTCFAANAPFVDESDENEPLSFAAVPMAADPFKDSFNAHSGPLRRVTTTSGSSYRGVRGKITVPGASDNNSSSLTLFSASQVKTLPSGKIAKTADAPYVYYGLHRGKYDMEGGIVWQKWAKDPLRNSKPYRWRLYMRSTAPHICQNCPAVDPKTHKPLQGWLQDDPKNSFDGPVSNVDMALSVSREAGGLVELKVTLPSDPSHPLVMQHQFSAESFPKDAKGVQIRRVHSIAQNDLEDFGYYINRIYHTYYEQGYMKTGSYYFGSAFSGGQVQRYGDQNGQWHDWDDTVTHNADAGYYPKDASIVNWVPYQLYTRDDNVRINLK